MRDTTVDAVTTILTDTGVVLPDSDPVLRGDNLRECARNIVEDLRTRSRVALRRPRTCVAEEVAQGEAVDAFARQRAGKGVALVVKAKAARDPGECLGDFEIPLDRAFGQCLRSAQSTFKGVL